MIETARLLLRAPRLDDLDPLAAMLADAEVVRFIGTGRPPSREEVWHRLLRAAGHWTLCGFGVFTIVERGSGRFVGQTGLARFARGLGPRFDPFPEASWLLDRAHHGRGLATEAASAALGWFEAGHGIGRTVCIIDPDNAPSLRIAAKLGYAAYGTALYRDRPVVMLERGKTEHPGAVQPG